MAAALVLRVFSYGAATPVSLEGTFGELALTAAVGVSCWDSFKHKAYRWRLPGRFVQLRRCMRSGQRPACLIKLAIWY